MDIASATGENSWELMPGAGIVADNASPGGLVPHRPASGSAPVLFFVAACTCCHVIGGKSSVYF